MIVGVGTDVVEIDRFGAVLARQGPRFVEKVFTRSERAYCEGKAGRIAHYAARFAAKEAVLKALGTGWSGGIRWTDVEVVRRATGPLAVKLAGIAAKRAKGATVHLSISHSDRTAVATAIIEENDGSRRRARS